MPKVSPSYSYWLGTFIVRGSVAPRVFVDVIIFGGVAIATVSREIAIMLKAGRKLGLDDFAWQRLEVLRAKAIDAVGGCERILETPLALSGAIQVRQFIFLLLVTVPFALTYDLHEVSSSPSNFSLFKQIGFVSLFVMLLAYPLLSLDRIGMELQNPFDTDRVDFLPLDEICVEIERIVLAFVHDFESSQAHAPKPEDATLPPDAKQPGPIVNADIS